MFRMPKILIIMCLSLSCALTISSNCLASTNTINLTYDFPTRMSLSVEHVNRIHFAGKQIKKIVGDSSQYNIILSENRKDIFVQLNVEQDQIINLSIIDIAGKVIDLEILAISSKYPSIVTLSDIARDSTLESKEEKEVNKMLTAMQQNMKGKYYVVAGGSSFDCGVFGKKASCQIVADYRFGSYRGIGLRVQRKGRGAVLLDSNIIAKVIPYKILRQTLASSVLGKSSKEIIYFVSKEEERDV